MSTGPWKRNKGVNMDVLKRSMKEASPADRPHTCPATCNLPTKMTEEAFTRRCQEHQQEDGSHCRTVCLGKMLPPGLEFIDLKQPTKEENMGTQTGKCDVCKITKSLKPVQGKRCCSTCEHLWRAAKNNPKTLLGLMVEAVGKEWIFEKLGSGLVCGEDLLRAEYAELKEKLEGALDVNAGLVEKMSSLSAERDAILESISSKLTEVEANESGYGDCDSKDIATEVSILKQENNRLREQLEEYSITFEATGKEITTLREQLEEATIELDATEYTSQLGQVVSRDSAILDLAIEAMEGKVSGIDAARLRALR